MYALSTSLPLFFLTLPSTFSFCLSLSHSHTSVSNSPPSYSASFWDFVLIFSSFASSWFYISLAFIPALFSHCVAGCALFFISHSSHCSPFIKPNFILPSHQLCKFASFFHLPLFSFLRATDVSSHLHWTLSLLWSSQTLLLWPSFHLLPFFLLGTQLVSLGFHVSFSSHHFFLAFLPFCPTLRTLSFLPLQLNRWREKVRITKQGNMLSYFPIWVQGRSGWFHWTKTEMRETSLNGITELNEHMNNQQSAYQWCTTHTERKHGGKRQNLKRRRRRVKSWIVKQGWVTCWDSNKSNRETELCAFCAKKQKVK